MSDSSTPSSPDNIGEQIGFPDVTSPSSSRSESPSTVNPKIQRGESATDDAIRYFESTYYDEYDYYNLTPDNKLFKHASGKGRTKREASQHTSRPSQWGMLAKFENEANNRKRHTFVKSGRTRSVSK
ncbi:uncharacterized protein LOC120344324 [Styela clava]|uniref:uncharacterized protein LOC120344324 n=1 Tax=Styela clava TaxID=7725 RepID=UPI00193A8224|nr:uncharacterized protein LOC120344324 [Styela clava]XP_039269421.1 uncharacterized protein LOC120344324 [Styela clava]